MALGALLEEITGLKHALLQPNDFLDLEYLFYYNPRICLSGNDC